MIPDSDHDGDVDARDYCDDLGGAVHFAPDEIKRDLAAPPSPLTAILARILTLLFWVAVFVALIWIL